MDLLPPEILFSLLARDVRHIPSIIHFSLTCRKYYELVHHLNNNDHYHTSILLWKEIFQQQRIDDPISYNVDYNYEMNAPATRNATAVTQINSNSNNDRNKAADWKTIVCKTYALKNNWERGKAVVSALPGIC